MKNNLNISTSIKNEYLFIIGIYALAYGFIFFNGSPINDDSVTTGFMHLPQEVLSVYKELGFFLYWPAYVHNFFFSFGDQAGIFMERTAIFFAYLSSAFFLNSALKKVCEISPLERIIIVLFFAVFPVNFSRIGFSNINYAISYFIFFGGIFMMGRYFSAKSIYYRIIALAAFFISFSANSILFFYLIVLVYIAYNEGLSPRSLKRYALRTVTYLDFISLPVVFWLIKSTFFVSYGDYEAYNTISSDGLIAAIPKVFKGFELYGDIIKLAFRSFNLFGFITLVAAFIVLRALIKGKYSTALRRKKSDLVFLIFGGFAFLAGIFPYVVVNKFFSINSWNDRHALLIPLGASFLLFYGVKLLLGSGKKSGYIVFALSFFLAIFVSSNSTSFMKYQRQHFKNLSLIENFRSSEIMNKNDTFIFVDRTKGSYDGVATSYYTQYEWTWLLAKAFGDQKRVGLNDGTYCYGGGYRDILERSQELKKRYLFGDYTPKSSNEASKYIVTVEYGNYPIHKIKHNGVYSLQGYKNFLNLMAWQITKAQMSGNEIKNIIRLHFQKLPDDYHMCE